MTRFKRWLSSSSFSRRFFEGSLGGSGSADSASRSSTSPISRKFFTDPFEAFGSSKSQPLVAGLAAQLAGVAAQFGHLLRNNLSIVRSRRAFWFVAGDRSRLLRGLLHNGRSIVRPRHASCFVARYRYARQEIIIQRISR